MATTRRQALRLIGSAPAAIGFGLSAAGVEQAQVHAAGVIASAGKGVPFKPRFFTPHEWQTVRVLVDLIIPKDARSGSATDAGVPEFMDFVMLDPLESDSSLRWRQTSMRGGLAWIDTACRKRFGQDLASSTEVQRHELLDDIAYSKPTGEKPMLGEAPAVRDDKRVRMRSGAAFFSSFRDLTASGFWSSKIGVADLGYVGNVATVWQGPPAEALRKLGLEPDAPGKA